MMKGFQHLLLLPLLGGCVASTPDKPNILWVTIEDTSPQFIGCYGNEEAHTPVIDQLASEGVRFTNAFSTGAVSSPSRSAIFTGVKTYETGTGNHRSIFPVPSFMKGFPWYMREAGYHTSNNAKTDYNVANEQQFIDEAWNESSARTGWWNRKPGQPFFAVFNFMDSHQSRTMTQPYAWYREKIFNRLTEDAKITDEAFEMPPFYHDSPEMRKQFARVYNAISLTDRKIGQLLSRLEADGLKDSTIIFLFADHGEGMPRGKTNGINYGYRVPFIAWFPEMYKHLSPWGTGGVVTDELIDFTDLAPTLISISGGDVPKQMKGRKLLGKDRFVPTDHLILSSDRSDNGIDMVRTITDGRYVYSRNYLPYMPEVRYIRYMEIGEIKQQMRDDLAEGKLNELQKSLFETRPAEFLFDIENDLWETRNLTEDPAFLPVLQKMRKQLKTHILQSRDVMFLPEYEIAKLSDTTTAWEFRLDKQHYPLEKIYEAASLSGFRGEETTKKQIRFLEDENKIVRYWAAVGLRSQASHDLQSYAKEILKAMNDVYPPVAVTASAIAWQVFNSSQAGKNLKKYCKEEDMNVVLMAIHYLQYSDNKRPFVETIRSVHHMEKLTYDVKAACMDYLGSLDLVPNNPDYSE